ncbi:MAG: hypothetical protein IPJ69_06025 [Deltaproteobacteria bacterium]|nr:MAG: hypothetical protein IPJ69_06025 [Deltaproteobacteria bacterium]
MKLTKLTLIFTLSLSSMISTSVFAELNIPRVLNFQSVLRDDAGNLLPDTTTALEFRILDADGTQLYFETQAEVPVTRGAVNAMIGEGDFPGTNTPTGGIPLNALDPTTGEKLLQYRIGNNESVDPIEFGLVPYAFWSEKSLGVVNDAIGSAQIKNGSIKLEDLEPGTISFGDVGGMIGVAQIPVSIARYSDLTAHMNNPTGAHRASAIVVDGLLSRIPETINNVQGVLVELARLLNDEISQRQTLDTNFANHISAGNRSAHSFSNISGTISNAQIADRAITADKLASGVVSASALADNSIGSSKIADESVTSTDIQNGTIRVEDIFQDEADSHSLDNRYVNEGGDTMTGNLSFDDRSCPEISPGIRRCLVDGVDVSQLNTDFRATQGADIPFSQVSGQIANTQVPQYMRPFAMASVNEPIFSGGSIPTVHYNISRWDGADNCAYPGIGYEGKQMVFYFETPSPDDHYLIQITNLNATTHTTWVISKNTDHFNICTFGGFALDIIIYHL